MTVFRMEVKQTYCLRNALGEVVVGRLYSSVGHEGSAYLSSAFLFPGNDSPRTTLGKPFCLAIQNNACLI